MPFLRRQLVRLTDQLTETQWDVARALALVVVIGGLGVLGAFVGVPVWRHWQNRKSLAQAEVFAQKRDYRDLLLSLRRATELAPGDLATWRAAAQILAEVGSPDTLVAQEQLTRLAPQDMALRLALVQDALRFGRFDTAEATLDGIDAAARRDVTFHRLAAALAMAMGRTTDLDRELRAIIAAEPGNLDAQFTEASLRLWGADRAAHDAGEAELEKLLTEPAVRVRAAIELLSSPNRLGSPAEVARVLTLVLARFAPNAAPDFTAPAVPAWNALIEGVKSAAASSAPNAALTARWLAEIGRWPDALAWIETLAPAVRNAPVVAEVDAEIAGEHDEIGRMATLLRAGAWGDWPANAQILALAARVQQLHYGEDRAQQTWGDAVAACGDSLFALRNLARLSSEWHYVVGEELVLQRVLKRDPKAFWAYSALRGLYLEQGDFAHLWELYGAWSKLLPDDSSVVAAWLMLGSVLDHSDRAALTRAAALHGRFPDSLPAEVAHAAVLWRMNRASEAAPILAALPPVALQRPDVSFWVALVQADLGHRAEAVAALARARPGATSAAERSLLDAAARKVQNGL
jgi:hypothetical protein